MLDQDSPVLLEPTDQARSIAGHCRLLLKSRKNLKMLEQRTRTLEMSGVGLEPGPLFQNTRKSKYTFDII